MHPEEYNEDFDGTLADYAAMYNWDPNTGEVLGAVMPSYSPCVESD
ncbi:MAG: hypothetical protein IJS84_02185 [Spirochaetales bacterium]|nr:hypothetical protein [Spirochaetales bacterium]